MDRNNRLKWVSLAYEKDYYRVVDKNGLAKKVFISGFVVPVIIPVPLSTAVSLLIKFAFKKSTYKVVNPKRLYHIVVKKLF